MVSPAQIVVAEVAANVIELSGNWQRTVSPEEGSLSHSDPDLEVTVTTASA